MKNRYVVIMAGGSGTRLWPMSRTHLPKQFQKLSSEKSLIRETYERIKDLVPHDNIYISLVKNILATSKSELPEIPDKNFIIEPEGKNTAPAIGLAAAKIYRINPQASVITIASDHTVDKLDNFMTAINKGFGFIEKNPDFFITVGIKPTRPDTGLGYINVGKKFKDSDLYQVDQFVEKPDLKTAQRYLKSGKYLWNASYFIWRADKLLEIYSKYAPNIYKNLVKILEVIGEKNEESLTAKYYKEMPKEPVDTAIAEKIKKIAVIPADLGWSDIGSWSTLYDFLHKKHNQHTISRGNHIGIDDKNCLIYAQDKLLATVGLQDIVVVDTPDVTLVCNKNDSQKVKDLIEKIKGEGKHHYL